MPMGLRMTRCSWRRAYPASAVLWIAMLVAVLGHAATAMAQPDFPRLTGRVVDDAGVLRSSTEQAISDQLEAHEAATTNQVVVVTVRSLEGLTIAEFGRRLGNYWGVGLAGQDNGVLLIVAPNEREVRIEVGGGLEGTLRDSLARTIIETEIIPSFRRGDLEGGVRAGTDAILAALEGSYEVPARSRPVNRSVSRSGPRFVPYLAIGVFVLVALMFGRDMGSDGVVRRRRWRRDDDDDWDDRHDPWHSHDDHRPRRRRRSGFSRSGGSGSSGGSFRSGGGSFSGGGASGKW